MSPSTLTEEDGFDDWPGVNEALVKKLVEKFPERCIRASESVEEAHRYAGKVELIHFLQMIYKIQNNK